MLLSARFILYFGLAFFGMMLTGCGGGGSSVAGMPDMQPPDMQQPPPTPDQLPTADPSASVSADNPLNPPQSGPPPPNPVPPDSQAPRVFTEGPQDPFFMSGGQGARFVNTDTRVYSNMNILGVGIAGTGGSFGVRLAPSDVRGEWNNGWSGQGRSVLIVDDFNNHHGYFVMFSLLAAAPRANVYGLTGPIRGVNYGDGGVRAAFNAPGNPASFDVVNASFGADLIPNLNPQNPRVAAWGNNIFFRDMRGQGPFLGARAVDAVLVKAAGNDGGADAGHLPDHVALVGDASIGPRVLIVGATDGYYNNGAGAQIAAYSNRAGSNANVRARFLVANGDAPFTDSSISVGGQPVDVFTSTSRRAGTSFAAPRVAGYAALMRHKFPNLLGHQTADIMLETATYQGLVCFPNCAENIYGQGRVDIGAALAPIGSMR